MDTCKQVGDFFHQSPSFSAQQAPVRTFSDADLSLLREQIKRIMIPKLIRVFELKLAAQQASMPPSRLMGNRPDLGKLQEIQNELDTLKNDIQLLLAWSENCLKQVDRAIEEVTESKRKMEHST